MSYEELMIDVNVKDGATTGYTQTAAEAYSVLASFERLTNTKFVCVKKPHAFGKKGLYS